MDGWISTEETDFGWMDGLIYKKKTWMDDGWMDFGWMDGSNTTTTKFDFLNDFRIGVNTLPKADGRLVSAILCPILILNHPISDSE